MDISKILPFLMNGKSGNSPRDELIKSALSGKAPDISTVLSLAQNSKKTAGLSGLKPIKGIACNEIMGALIKYFC